MQKAPLVRYGCSDQTSTTHERSHLWLAYLRTRLIEDLRIRNYASRTIDIYVRCVALFAKHFGRSPEDLGAEEVREYQLYLREEKKASWAFFNQTVSALRFLYGKTLKHDWLVEQIPYPRQEKRLPDVLSFEEVSKLFSCVRTLMSCTILQTMYGAGLISAPFSCG